MKKKVELEKAMNGYIVIDERGNITLQPSFDEMVEFVKLHFEEK